MVNENDPLIRLADVEEKVLQLKDGLLALLCSARRRKNLLKRSRTIQGAVADLCEQHQRATRLEQAYVFDSKSLNNLQEITSSMFPGKDAVKE